MRMILVVFLFLTVHPLSAQEDFTWWNDIHQWDGVTPWNQYLTISAARFGPNALPVPLVRNGLVDTVWKMEVAAGGHFSRGDRTWDSELRFVLPVARQKVLLEASVVPIEFYRMDTVTRDLRAARDRDGRGHAGGDILVSTLITLVKDRKRLPDMLFEVALRTASGTQLGAARYTDAPGYHFLVSAGKSLGKNWRWYGQAGFYSYQTYDLQKLQNDCFLYGIGIDKRFGSWNWSNQLAGYAGYHHNGDSPIVFRSRLRFIGQRWDGWVDGQWGLHDFGYRSLHIGTAWKLPYRP